MSKIIEDFSKSIERTALKDGKKFCVSVKLEIQEPWFDDVLVAYTFNSYQEDFQDLFAEALEKYKKLVYTTGVTGRTLDDVMQSTVTCAMQSRFGDRLTTRRGKLGDTIFELK